MRLPWMQGYIEAVCRLSPDTLLVIGWCLADGDLVRVRVGGARDGVNGQARWIRYSRPDLRDRPHPVGAVILAHLEKAVPASALGAIEIEAAGARFAARHPRVADSVDDIDAVLCSRLTWLDQTTRQRILSLLAESLNTTLCDKAALARRLNVIRNALAPAVGDSSNGTSTRSAQVEAVLRTSDTSFYLKGWFAAATRVNQVTACSPEGHVVDLVPHVQRVQEMGAAVRPARQTFIAHVTMPSPSLLRDGWTVQVIEADGTSATLTAPPVTVDPRLVREAILLDAVSDRSARSIAIERHVHPALTRIQQDASLRPAIDEVIDFGACPAAPDVSIVICLYRRIDLLQHQLVQFAVDAGMRETEIIYVLDSPELGEALRETAFELHDLHRIPFRVVTLAQNAGYGGANNAGVSVASGRLALLLNSDVFPGKPGWLASMVQFHDSTPDIGVLGPKLLFEDGTIQHAGIYFEKAAGSYVWSNRHYFKGFERNLHGANVAREVPAVSGACMLIDTALYREHEGFRGCYVQGDYEDSDLCLRLRAAGRRNWYCPTVELYHLEGQSYDWKERAPASRYNAWLQTHLWDDALTETMRALPR